MVAPMTATRTPLLTALASWPTGPGRSPAGRRAASGWSDDPALVCFATPGEAAVAVGFPACGAAVLTALAARRDDSWATTAALASLAPRLAPIVVRWVRAGMCPADVEDAESDLLAGCLAGLREDRLLDPAGIVATAWQRASNNRRTLRARGARHTGRELGVLPDPVPFGRDGVEAIVVELTDAVRTGRLTVASAKAVGWQAAGWTSGEVEACTGIPAATLRARRRRAVGRLATTSRPVGVSVGGRGA